MEDTGGGDDVPAGAQEAQDGGVDHQERRRPPVQLRRRGGARRVLPRPDGFGGRLRQPSCQGELATSAGRPRVRVSVMLEFKQ